MKAKLSRKKTLWVIIVLFFSCQLSVAISEKVQANVEVSAQAAILIDAESGRILYAKNIDEALRIASITKIMTTLLALEQGNLTEQVLVSKNAVGVEGSSIYLRLGEKLTLEDMLYGLMLRSGNDAAVAIAEHIAGSVEGFVFLMNQKAAELGLNKTIFSNPHGLDDQEEHYSTARDMAVLTAYALKNENFALIAKTKRKTAPLQGESWGRVWYNKNRLLSKYPYADGVKTGYTERANRTLVSSATKDGQQLIVVTLNAPDDWNDHIALYEFGFAHYSKVILAQAQEKISIESRQKDDGYFQVLRSFVYPLAAGEHVQRKIILDPLFINDKRPHEHIPYPAGYLLFKLGEEELGRIPLQFVPLQQERSFWESYLFVLKGFLGGLSYD